MNPHFSSPPNGTTVILNNNEEDRLKLEKAKRGLKVTSICHIILGLIMMLCSIYYIFRAQGAA
jgi:hypothetical protein